MKWILPLCCAALVCLGETPSTPRTVTLAWDYNPADGLTNYSFTLYWSTSATALLPWPMLTNVAGVKSVSVVASNALQFYYVTATDLRSNPTNYVSESDPSGVVSVRLLPSGTLTVGRGQ